MKRTAVNEVIAYHESGHAVTAGLLGMTMASVSIRPDDATAGRCVPAPSSSSPRLTPDGLCMVSIAGWVAAEMIRPNAREFLRRNAPRAPRVEGVRWAPIPPRPSEAPAPAPDAADVGPTVMHDDWSTFVAAARLGGHAEATTAELVALVRRTAATVNAILWQHWRAVEVIAEELLSFGEVSGDRVREVVESVRRSVAA